MTQQQAMTASKLAKPCYEAIKKISKGKWEWEPEVGEWCVDITEGPDKSPCLIEGVKYDPRNEEWFLETHGNWWPYNPNSDYDIVPLLHWESILKILRSLGYGVFVETQSHNCRATISRDGMEIIRKIGEGSQSAMLQAVIALGKEKANEKG